MMNHLILAALIIVSFWAAGHKNITKFLLFWAIFSLPLEYDHTFLESFYNVQEFQGWVAGFTIRLSDVFVLLLLIFGKAADPDPDRPAPAVKVWHIHAVTLFVLACLLSLTTALWRRYCLFELFQLGKTVYLYYFVMGRFVRDRKGMDYVAFCLACALFFQGGLAVVQWCFQDFYTVLRTGTAPRLTLFGDYIRSQGTVGQPNVFAAFLVPIMLLNQSILSRAFTSRRKFLLCAQVVGLLGLVFSLSRGAWIGFVLGFVILALVSGKDKTRRRMWASLIILGLIVLVLWPFMHQRIVGDDGGAALDRKYLNQIAAEVIKANVWLGVGINNYRFAMYNYIPEGYEWNFIYRVHNVFLLVFAETGILGFVAIVFLFVFPFCDCLRLRKVCDADSQLYLNGILAGMAAMVVENMVDIAWCAPGINGLYFVLLAIVTALSQTSAGIRTDDITEKEPDDRQNARYGFARA